MMQFRYVLTKQAPEEAGCLCYLQKEQSLYYTPWRGNYADFWLQSHGPVGSL